MNRTEVIKAVVNAKKDVMIGTPVRGLNERGEAAAKHRKRQEKAKRYQLGYYHGQLNSPTFNDKDDAEWMRGYATGQRKRMDDLTNKYPSI